MRRVVVVGVTATGKTTLAAELARRLVERTARRVLGRKELWNGNRETFYGVFCAPDNLLADTLARHGRLRREYPRLFAQPEYAHLRVIRLRRPRDAARWLASL